MALTSGGGGKVHRHAIGYALATAASRVVALLREVVAARLFGVSPTMSAFAVAFQIPNLLRSLFADAALQGAVVPSFARLVDRRQTRELLETFSALLVIFGVSLSLLSLAFAFVAEPTMQIIAPGLADHSEALRHLAANLARIMFPVVMLITIAGLVGGALNAVEDFTLAALAPAVWNAVIVLGLVAGTRWVSGAHQIYLYAVSVVVGSAVQLAWLMPRLRRYGFRLTLPKVRNNPELRGILKTMLPVTLALGVMNFNLLVDSFFGSLVSASTPAALDKAYRLFQLPQGIFSIAIATVMYPALARSVAQNDLRAVGRRTIAASRLIAFALFPTSAALFVLSTPLVQLIFQRGAFDARATDLTATALRWMCVALPVAGLGTFLWRVLFSLGAARTAILATVGNVIVNVAVSAVLYRPMGVPGVVAGTVAGSVAMTVIQAWIVRAHLRRELAVAASDAADVAVMILASLLFGLVSYLVGFVFWRPTSGSDLESLFSLAGALALGAAAYMAVTAGMGVSEARWLGARLRPLRFLRFG